MNKMSDIQMRVEEAMNSVLNISRATPQPFFYTRLMARITYQESNSWERMSRFVSRPVFAIITMSLILVLNTFVAFNETSSHSGKPELSEVATADDLGTNTFYDIENVQP